MFLSPDSNYCAGGSLTGRGWKYGSGFVDGIFPVLSPIAQQILTFIEKEKYLERIWSSLDSLHPTNHTWDDLINVAMCEWILCRSSFLADMICYNLLIEAYGQSSLVKKAESTYLALLDARCVPTEDTSALLLKSYSKCGMLEKAEADFSVMRKNGLPPMSDHVAEEHIKILEKEVSFMRENQERVLQERLELEVQQRVEQEVFRLRQQSDDRFKSMEEQWSRMMSDMTLSSRSFSNSTLPNRDSSNA
ncbi:hypothetical protein FXO37_02176 [Capsicum annuum]|nr:hypothetical protein FXO37_02176 [Capsicum annuum]